MNLIASLHLTSFVTYALLVIYVLGKRPGDRLNHFCSLLIFTIGTISLCYTFMNSVETTSEAMVFVNLNSFGLCFAPMTALWFYLALAKKEHILHSKVFISISVLLPLVFVVFYLLGYMATNVVDTDWGRAVIWSQSPYTYAYLVYCLTMCSICGWLLLHIALEERRRYKRKSAWLMLITGSISILLTYAVSASIHQFGILSLLQVPDVLLLIWVIGVVLAMSRYGLMGITPVLAYSEILSTMSDSLILLDDKGKITFANSATASLLGVGVNDLVGREFTSFVRDPEDAKRLLEDTLSSGSAKLELVYLSKTAAATPVIASTSIVLESPETIAGFVVSATDITQQKMAQAKISSHQQLIDTILETFPSAVVVLRKDNTIILANKLFYQDLLAGDECIEGKPLIDIIRSADLLKQISVWRELSYNSAQIEFRYNVNDSEREFLINIIKMNEDNILLVFSDVTMERERQDRLYLTDRLASVGEMAAGIAHEINNPLTSVIGLSSMLVDQDMPTECKEDMKSIYKEAVRASEVVHNILTFARKHPPVRQLTQIHSVIDDVLRLRFYEHKVNNISVIKNYEDNIPEIVVDYYQMQQVFLNIVLNAEYEMIETHGGGTLTVTTSSHGDYVSVTFKDDGPGLPAENVKRIFDPFFTTKEIGKGTGLGLSISYGIIVNHGGKITVESEIGRGAAFTIELPVTSPVLAACI